MLRGNFLMLDMQCARLHVGTLLGGDSTGHNEMKIRNVEIAPRASLSSY